MNRNVLSDAQKMKKIKIRILECGVCRRYYLDDKDITDWVVEGQYFSYDPEEDVTTIELTIFGEAQMEISGI